MAVGSTFVNPQDPDCTIFYASEYFTDVFASVTHAENPKVVSANLLSKIWRIDSENEKRTIKTTAHLNRHDSNSNLSWDFGTNDWMLRYKCIE